MIPGPPRSGCPPPGVSGTWAKGLQRVTAGMIIDHKKEVLDVEAHKYHQFSKVRPTFIIGRTCFLFGEINLALSESALSFLAEEGLALSFMASFSSFFFSDSACLAFSSRALLNMLTKRTRIEVTAESKTAKTWSVRRTLEKKVHPRWTWLLGQKVWAGQSAGGSTREMKNYSPFKVNYD